MSDFTLRGQILRLAREDLELRPALVKILEAHAPLSREEQTSLKVGNTMIIQQPPIQQPPIVIQHSIPAQTIVAPPIAPQVAPPIAPPAPGVVPATPNGSPVGIPAPTIVQNPVSSLMVPERTERGFNQELLPELQRLTSQGLSKTQAAQELLKVVFSAFAKKDMLYNILIQYQSSFENDTDFLENLERMIAAWATSNFEV